MLLEDLRKLYYEDDWSDTTANLKTFCAELVNYCQWKSARFLHSGSKMEIPSLHNIAPLFGISIDKLDIDEMVYSIHRIALPTSQPVPDSFIGNIFRICSEGMHAGYVRLVRNESNEEFLWSQHRLVRDDEIVHRPAVLQDVRKSRAELSNPKHVLSNSQLNEVVHQKFIITAGDLVTAVHSPYWPEEAAEWATRPRVSGFPSRSVIKQVISYGCDFVPVSHKFGSRDEWRFSFSKAELLIIKNWMITQTIVYGKLWLINKKIEGSHICTYYLKTLMLWANEQKSRDFWKVNLNESACEILIHLIACIHSKFCPNYFIPSNNMMDHLIDTDLSHDIAAFWACLKSNLFVSNSKILLSILINTANYELLAWVKRAVVIYDGINNEEDNFVNLYRSEFAPEFLSALSVELNDIFRSLVSQQEAAHLKHILSPQQIHNKYVRSEVCLMMAAAQCEIYEIDTFKNCDHLTVRSIENAYMVHSRQKQSSRSRFVAEWSGGFNSATSTYYERFKRERHMTDEEFSAEAMSSNLTQSRKIGIIEHDLIEIKMHKEWPGKSPTVNISWFIAKAYLANLYFVTNRDVTLTLKVCDDVIAVKKLSYMNERHAERSLLVVLSTEMAGIFDRRIQELLGFYSLCSFIKDEGGSRSVYLGVCPVLFVMYIKLRVANTVHTDVYSSIFDDFVDHFNSSCKCDVNVISGHRVLFQIFYNSRKNQKE